MTQFSPERIVLVNPVTGHLRHNLLDDGTKSILLFRDQETALRYAEHSTDDVNWVPSPVQDDLVSWAENMRDHNDATEIVDVGPLGGENPFEINVFIGNNQIPWNPNA